MKTWHTRFIPQGSARRENKFDGAAPAKHIEGVRILFFAQSRDAAGCEEARLEVERPIAGEELWDRLIKKYSGLTPLRRASRLARRETYLNPDDLLQPNDEIAIIPPVSGG